MNDQTRPTPETDEYVKMRASLAYCVERDTADFARRMERERDELRHKMQFFHDQENRIIAMMAERDELRDALNCPHKLRAHVLRTMGEADIAHLVGDKAQEVLCQRDELLEALEAMAYQHKCGCGHPFCNRCADDKMCQEAIAKVRGKPTT